MERRLASWSAVLLLLVPFILGLPHRATCTPFNYPAHCRDMDAGTNALFVYTVRNVEGQVAAAYSRHFADDTNHPPPYGDIRLVRMFALLRRIQDTSQDIENLVSQVEEAFVIHLDRLERICKRQIHG